MKNAVAKLPASPYPRIQFSDNRFSPSIYVCNGKAWKIGDPALLKFRIDVNSHYEDLHSSGLRNAEVRSANGYGARKLSPTVKKIYDRLINFAATPAGLVPVAAE